MSEQEDDLEAVRLANEAFYRAFRDRSYVAMESIWAKRSPVACIHPGMDVIMGRPKVLESWRGILSHDEAPKMVCDRVEVRFIENLAYVTCLEGQAGKPPALIAINIWVREDETWRLALHQAGPLSSRNRQGSLPEEPDEKVWN